jgi:hypothetical protein
MGRMGRKGPISGGQDEQDGEMSDRENFPLSIEPVQTVSV